MWRNSHWGSILAPELIDIFKKKYDDGEHTHLDEPEVISRDAVLAMAAEYRFVLALRPRFTKEK